MTVEPGFGAQKFMADMMPKVKKIRQMLDEVNPACILEVDGGVDAVTYKTCRENGAEVLVTNKVPLRSGTLSRLPDLRMVAVLATGYDIIDTADAELIKGKRMLIVDDVISTGESLRAMEELVTRAGGIVAGRMAVLAEGDAQKRHDIICLAPLPLFNPDGTVKE